MAAGVSDFSQASSATEYGLFSDSSFNTIPEGGSPVPADWGITSLTFDQILLGSESAAGGFGNANAYLTEAVSGGGDGDGGDDPDTTAPVITLIGEPELTITVGDEYTDAGATAQDETDGDISDEIEVSGADFDRNTAGTYSVSYTHLRAHET